MIRYAQKRFDDSIANYRRVDDKAAAVLGYLGAGTGLVTLGSVSSAVLDKASVWVVLACIPSVGFGLAALRVAAIARQTAQLWNPPDATDVAILAEYYREDEKAAEAALIANLTECTNENLKAAGKKAALVNKAVRYFRRGVFWLTIPLLAVVAEKAAEAAKKAKQPQLIEERSQ